MDWVHYTLNREGDTADELTVTVILGGPAGNDWGLDTTKTSQDVTFAAGSATAEQSIRLTGDGFGQIGFSLSATTSGALTARLGATTGYDTSDTDEVEVVVTSGPAWVIKLAEDHYRFDEDGGDQDIELVATATSADMPAPSLDPSNRSVLAFSLVTHGDTALASVDYTHFSLNTNFPSSEECSADPNAGNVQVCRSNVTFTPVDDAEAEPDETLELVLARTFGTSPVIHFQGPGPDRTVSGLAKTYPATIVDDEFGVTGVTVTSTPRLAMDTYGAWEHIELSVSFNKPVTVTGAPTFSFDLGGTTNDGGLPGGLGHPDAGVFLPGHAGQLRHQRHRLGCERARARRWHNRGDGRVGGADPDRRRPVGALRSQGERGADRERDGHGVDGGGDVDAAADGVGVDVSGHLRGGREN